MRMNRLFQFPEVAGHVTLAIRILLCDECSFGVRLDTVSKGKYFSSTPNQQNIQSSNKYSSSTEILWMCIASRKVFFFGVYW